MGTNLSSFAHIDPCEKHIPIPATVDLPDSVMGDKRAIFLTSLLLHTSLSPEARQHGFWINMSRNYIRSLIGRSYYPDVIVPLMKVGVIERNGRYSTGSLETEEFCKSYRFARLHRLSGVKPFQLRRKKGLQRATRIYLIDEKNLGPAGMHFRQCFDYFSIDRAAIEESDCVTDFWDSWAICRWLNREEFARRCEYGRYHCLASQLPRKLRKYLRVDGERDLSIVDISCCQPLLLALLIALSPIIAPASKDITAVMDLAASSQNWRTRAPKDIQHWLELCETRALYGFLLKRVQDLPGPAISQITLTSDRIIHVDLKNLKESSFKRSSLIPVFDKLPRMLQNPVFRVISERFPTIAGWLVRSKSDGVHQRVACCLQTAESVTMIDRLGLTLRDRHPNERVQPIHDAWLVRTSFAPVVIAMFQEQFGSYGLRPHVKQESTSECN